jgi:hypothetical protein
MERKTWMKTLIATGLLVSAMPGASALAGLDISAEPV